MSMLHFLHYSTHSMYRRIDQLVRKPNQPNQPTKPTQPTNQFRKISSMSCFSWQGWPYQSSVKIEKPNQAFESKLRALLPANFRLVSTAWNDASRGSVGGFLSAMGPNITDVTLKHLDSQKTVCTIVAGDNLNPLLGVLSSQDVQLVVQQQQKLQTIRLDKFLENIGQYGQYVGMKPDCDLSSSLDDKVSIRFQCAFIQAEPGVPADLYVECFNYQTRAADDPKNLLVMSTTQGAAIQQDQPGRNKILLDKPDQMTSHALKLETTRFGVGEQQTETQAERQAAHQAGKAVSGAIGVRSMNQRLNCVVTVQVPLQQKPVASRSASYASTWGLVGSAPGKQMAYSTDDSDGCDEECDIGGGGGCVEAYGGWLSANQSFASRASLASSASSASSASAASAARASIGEQVGRVSQLANKDCKRHPTEHLTVTITTYWMCSDVPTKAEIDKACQDLTDQYGAISSAHLASQKLAFARQDIGANQLDQPAQPAQPDQPVVRPTVQIETPSLTW